MKKILNMIKIVMVGVVFTILMIMLLAFFMNKFDLGEGVINGGVIGIMIMATFLNGIVSGKVNRHKKWLYGVIVGGLYFIIWVMVSLFLKKSVVIDKNMFTTMMICLGSTTLGAMLS